MLKNKGTALTDFLTLTNIVSLDFELIEDNTIDDIEEIENEVMRDDWRYYVPMFFNKINELVRSNNKLNKEIKELKEGLNNGMDISIDSIYRNSNI